MKNNALTLFEHAGLVATNKEADVIFTTVVTTSILPKDSKQVVKTSDPEEVQKLLNEGGTVVGTQKLMKQIKQSDARNLLSLKGKDNTPQWEMTKRDAEVFAANVVLNRVNGLDRSRIGLKRYQEKIGADGLTTIDIKLKEVPFKEAAITVEQAMVAWPDKTREEIIAGFVRAGLRPKGMATVDIKTAVVPPPQISEGTQEVIKEAEATEKLAQGKSKSK